MTGIRDKKEKAEKYQAFLDNLDPGINNIIPVPVNPDKLKIGDYVTYVDNHEDNIHYEHGRLKSFSVRGKLAYVVYHCNNDWDHYQNYTAACTGLFKLYPGWLSEADVKKIP